MCEFTKERLWRAGSQAQPHRQLQQDACPVRILASNSRAHDQLSKLASKHPSQESHQTHPPHPTRPALSTKAKRASGGGGRGEGYYDLVGAEDAELHELDLGHLGRRVREPRVHLGPTRRRSSRRPPPPRVSDRGGPAALAGGTKPPARGGAWRGVCFLAAEPLGPT